MRCAASPTEGLFGISESKVSQRCSVLSDPVRESIRKEGTIMKTRTLVIATSIAAALSLGACSSNPSGAQVGTGVGAVAGGLVGNAVLGTPGAIAGAVGGGLVGHELGENRDQRKR